MQRLYKQKIWLGGLDSNQDNQIQSLMYYRLYDLPAVERHRIGCGLAYIAIRSRPTLLYSRTAQASTTARQRALH